MKTLVALSMLFALTAPAATPAASAPAPRYGDWGFDVSGMDRATRPGDDFFQFADGEWAARTPIPPDRSFAGMSDALADKVEARLHAIMEAAARNPRGRGAQAKIGAAYRAYMDEAGIEARRTAPLQPDLAAIRATRSAQEMAALMGRSPGSYFASVLDLSIAADPRRPGRYQVRIGQGGLGLPDRDYYLVPDLAEKLTAYRGYVARMLRLAGWPDPETAAQGVVEFETRIARASRSQAEERDPLKSYVPVTVAGLEASTPGFPWTR
jgi:putative endopeptidase